jgi:hypothetical protein
MTIAPPAPPPLTPEQLRQKHPAGAGMPMKGATSAPGRGSPDWTPIGRGSAAAEAGREEAYATKHKPELVAKRLQKGK